MNIATDISTRLHIESFQNNHKYLNSENSLNVSPGVMEFEELVF